MYHVVCDGCGADAQEGSEHVAWVERDTARIDPVEGSDWWTDGADRDLCPDCAVTALTTYQEGDSDPTPIKRPADGRCRAYSNRYSCTWPLGHTHPQHVAGDNGTVCCVWPVTA